MKTKFIKICLMTSGLLLNNPFLIAQSSSASNALSGTQTAPTQFLGSSNLFDVIYRTNNIERYRLSSASGALQLTTGTNILGALGGAKILGAQGNTAASPAYGFSGDLLGIGMHRPLANTIGFATQGLERVRISPGGNVLINTTIDAGVRLGVNGNALIGSDNTGFPSTPFSPVLRVKGDNIGLLRTGVFGASVTGVGPGEGVSQWLSLGLRPSTTIGFNSYGFRTQWDKNAADFALQERTAGATRDAVVTWQDAKITGDPCIVSFTPAFLADLSALRFVFRNGQTPSNPNSSLEAARFRLASPTVFTGCGTVAFMGINNNNPIYELDVRGKINASSQVLAAGVVLTSDRRFKKDIISIENGMDLIRQLNPVNYKFKVEEFKDKYDFDNTLQYGFIAQELETVMPSSVVAMQDGYKGVNYTSLIPVLTNAIKTMDTKMQAMEAEINTLKAENSSMKQSSNSNTSNTAQNNANTVGAIKLLQNIPNPFGNTTMIQYDLGENVKNVKLLISDFNGKTIQIFENLEKSGSIEVNASALNNGIYVYSLVNGNNEILLSKQMLVQKQ